MDRSRYEDELLRHLLPGLGAVRLCHGYRVTGVNLERNDDESIVRIRLGCGEQQQLILLDRVIWNGGQEMTPDFMSATLTTAIEEWACAVDTPRERDVERGETTI